jgi:transcriptional regulator with XRE-family HTH domain
MALMNEGKATARSFWLQNFGARLRLMRECCDASQRDLAKASGVSRSTLSRYEQGRVSPKPVQRARLVNAMYGDVEFLVPGAAAPTEEDLAAMRLLFRLKKVAPPQADTALRLIEGLLGELGRYCPQDLKAE